LRATRKTVHSPDPTDKSAEDDPASESYKSEIESRNFKCCKLQVGDECLIAPLSLFTPELLSISGPKSVHGQVLYEPQAEDPHDGNYLRETSVRISLINIYIGKECLNYVFHHKQMMFSYIELNIK